MRSPAAILVTLLLAGCGSAAHAPATERAVPARALAQLRAQSRPVGRGPRFQPPSPTTAVVGCRPALGPRIAAHVELFADDRVVLLPVGIGTRPPRRLVAGRVAAARCYGAVVTLDPTGTVLIAPTAGAVTLGALFAQWGVPLSARRVASFAGSVRVYVAARRFSGDPRGVVLSRHAEVVVEVGPYVTPHARYAFAAGT